MTILTSDFKFFSMFTGIGGFELGIERAYNNQCTHKCKESEQKECEQRRFRTSNEQDSLFLSRQNAPLCVGYSEIDKFAIQTFEKNYGGIKNYGDATKINAEELPDFDLLVGGFPCQAFSLAGKRRGFEDTRGTLFFDVARILKVKRPKVVLLENVKGLLNHEKGQTFRVILESLSELGYNIEWMVLNSKFFGVPQNRERVFIIGSLRGKPRPEILPFSRYEKEIDRPLSEFSCSQTLTTRTGSTAKQQTIIYPTLSTELAHSTGRDYFRNGGQKLMRASNQLRRLTPIECERLQGYPDNWTQGVSDTQRYKQLGNSVTVNVIEALFNSFNKKLNEEEKKDGN